jgi:hypothetical protein
VGVGRVGERKIGKRWWSGGACMGWMEGSSVSCVPGCLSKHARRPSAAAAAADHRHVAAF